MLQDREAGRVVVCSGRQGGGGRGTSRQAGRQGGRGAQVVARREGASQSWRHAPAAPARAPAEARAADAEMKAPGQAMAHRVEMRHAKSREASVTSATSLKEGCMAEEKPARVTFSPPPPALLPEAVSQEAPAARQARRGVPGAAESAPPGGQVSPSPATVQRCCSRKRTANRPAREGRLVQTVAFAIQPACSVEDRAPGARSRATLRQRRQQHRLRQEPA